MQWRQFTRVFTRLKHTTPAFRSSFPLAPRRNISRGSFRLVDGKFTNLITPLQTQPQIDWNEEVDDVDDDVMAHQELSQLQQFLGLVAPKNDKPVKDVVFVCIDCEAFEHDHNKITEIGTLRNPF